MTRSNGALSPAPIAPSTTGSAGLLGETEPPCTVTDFTCTLPASAVPLLAIWNSTPTVVVPAQTDVAALAA